MKSISIKQILTYFLIVYSLSIGCAQNSELVLNKERVVLSAIKGGKSKVDTLIIYSHSKLNSGINIQITGINSSYFKLLVDNPQIESNGSLKIPVQFQPDSTFVGVANADIFINKDEASEVNIKAYGLSIKGLEGKNEPPLSYVIETFGFSIDLGWDTLANHVNSELQGDELPQVLFKKASGKMVEFIPVARYSPPFTLPFGYYSFEKDLPILKEIGVLSNSELFPEHQTLFPEISYGGITFEPHSEPFGFYTTSPSHTAYTEDKWNEKFHKKNAKHACRIYPLKDSKGVIIPNQFLICFEEAFNGDYQDYVFSVKNVEIINY